MNHIVSCMASVLILCSSITAAEGFSLLSRNAESKSSALEFRYEAGQKSDYSPTGYLIPASCPEAEWTVQISPETTPGAFEVKKVQIGPWPALHLVADSELPAGTSFHIKLKIDATNCSGADQKFLKSDQTLFESLFPDFNYSRTHESKQKNTISNPLFEQPGDYRFGYQGGDRLYRISDSELTSKTLEFRYDGLAVSSTRLNNEYFVYAPFTDIDTNESDSIFASEGTITAAATRSAFDTLQPPQSEVPQQLSRTYNNDNRYERGSIQPNGERFVFWRIFAGQSMSEDLAVDDLLTTPELTATFTLLGFIENNANPAHFADMSVEGVDLPRTSWAERTENIYSADVILPEIPDDGLITITHAIDSQSPDFGNGQSNLDFQNLDIVKFDYEAFPRINSEGFRDLELPAAPMPRLVTIGGFPAGTEADDLLLLDITDHHNPVQLTAFNTFPDQSGNVAVGFEDSGSDARYFVQLVNSITGFDTTTQTEFFPPLPGINERLGEIYIHDPVFREELVPLSSRTQFVQYYFDPQAAYNIYSDGRESPDSIQSALRDILEFVPFREPFPAVILIGKGSYDRANRLGFDRSPQIPAYIDGTVDSGIQIESAVDYPYATLLGNDNFPDARVGRIPAVTEEELEIVVSRILAHEALADDLTSATRPALFITDNDPDFLSSIPLLTDRWDNNIGISSRYDIDGSNDHQDAKALIETDSGPSLIFYTGHGNNDRWAAERIFDNNTAQTVQTENRWPIITTFTCLSGNFAIPGADIRCLSETWLLTPEKGSPFNVAPTAVDTFAAQQLFSQQVIFGITDVANPPAYAGDMMLTAQTRFNSQFPFLDRILRAYVSFGHPNTRTTFAPVQSFRTDNWYFY